jgi:hypothetical protein
MSEPNKPKSANWMSLISDDLLGRIGTPVGNHVETYGSGNGFSVATSRHSGTGPPDDAVHVIATIR